MKNRIFQYLLISLTLLMFGCDRDGSTLTTYIYKNSSGVDILLDKIYSSTLRDTNTVKNDEVYIFSISYEGGGPIYPFACDTINVIYNKNKFKKYYKGDTTSRNILNIDNYSMHQIDENKYEMYYTFTEQDYFDADSIK